MKKFGNLIQEYEFKPKNKMVNYILCGIFVVAGLVVRFVPFNVWENVLKNSFIRPKTFVILFVILAIIALMIAIALYKKENIKTLKLYTNGFETFGEKGHTAYSFDHVEGAVMDGKKSSIKIFIKGKRLDINKSELKSNLDEFYLQFNSSLDKYKK